MVYIVNVEFFQLTSGRIPVKEFLDTLEPKLRAKAFRDIEVLRNLGGDLREPYVKPIKGSNNKGLYELRIKFSRDIARIFYFTYHNNRYIMLSGFVKKSMRTPSSEIEKARRYMEDYKRRSGHE